MIAVGALLPGIGGAFTRAGRVEVLYVILMEAGRIRSDGPPEKVFSQTLFAEVYGQPMRVVEHPFRDCPLILVDD